jgi:hypothetical protein
MLEEKEQKPSSRQYTLVERILCPLNFLFFAEIVRIDICFHSDSGYPNLRPISGDLVISHCKVSLRSELPESPSPLSNREVWYVPDRYDINKHQRQAYNPFGLPCWDEITYPSSPLTESNLSYKGVEPFYASSSESECFYKWFWKHGCKTRSALFEENPPWQLISSEYSVCVVGLRDISSPKQQQRNRDRCCIG